MTLAEFTYDNLGEDVYNTSKTSCSTVFCGKHGSFDYDGGNTQRNVAKLNSIYVSKDMCDVWYVAKPGEMRSDEPFEHPQGQPHGISKLVLFFWNCFCGSEACCYRSYS